MNVRSEENIIQSAQNNTLIFETSAPEAFKENCPTRFFCCFWAEKTMLENTNKITPCNTGKKMSIYKAKHTPSNHGSLSESTIPGVTPSVAYRTIKILHPEEYNTLRVPIEKKLNRLAP